MNHSEIYNGILLNDWMNATPISTWKSQRDEFARLIAHFDAGEIKSSEDLARRFMEEVLKGRRNSALNLYPALRESKRNKSPDERRAEIRSVRAQRNAKIWALTVRLFDSRIEYLKTLKSPLAFENHMPSLNPVTKLASFRRYVTEPGNNWKEFLPLLNWRYRILDSAQSACGFVLSPFLGDEEDESGAREAP